MLSQPDLSQSKQPKAHYDYDGISGGWLWFPWWVHVCVAVLAWPICWWILPLLPFQNQKISGFIYDYRIQIATSITILTVLTAILSYLKALKISRRDAVLTTTKKRAAVTKEIVKETPVKKEPVKKSRVKNADNEVQQVKSSTTKKTTTKAAVKSVTKPATQSKAKAKTATTAVEKKKRAPRKKSVKANDQQTELNL